MPECKVLQASVVDFSSKVNTSLRRNGHEREDSNSWELNEQKKSLALQQESITSLIERIASLENPAKTVALK